MERRGHTPALIAAAFGFLFLGAIPSAAALPLAQGEARENPIQFAYPWDIGDNWLVAVVATDPNATARVLGVNSMNRPPPAGSQMVMVDLAVTNTGPIAAWFPYSRLRVVGPSAVSYDSSASCGTVPEPLTADAVPTGQGIVGQLCWIVPRDQVAGLVLYATPPPFSDQRPTFFALSAPVVATSGTASVGSVGPVEDPFAPPAAGNASLGQRAGSLANPVRRGAFVDVGDGWELAVVSYDPSALRAVQDSYRRLYPQATDISQQVRQPLGQQYVLVTLAARYSGERPQRVPVARVHLIGPAGTELVDRCAATPQSLELTPELARGESVRGAICRLAPTPDVNSLLLYASPPCCGGDNIFFSLAP
jgi:hypothetical protein